MTRKAQNGRLSGFGRGSERRLQCRWSEDHVRCAASHFGPQALLFERDGQCWCAFHRPEDAAEYIETTEKFLTEALVEIIKNQVQRHSNISLPGFHIPFDFQLLEKNILDTDSPSGWGAQITRIDLRGCVFSGDVMIAAIGAAGMDIDAQHMEALGSVYINGNKVPLGHIDFGNAKISGDISIGRGDAVQWQTSLGSSPDSSAQSQFRLPARRISLTGIKHSRRVAISGIAMSAPLKFSGSKIKNSLQLADCLIDPTPSSEKRRPEDLLDDCLRNALELGNPLDEHDPTKVGTLFVHGCEIHGSIQLNPRAVTGLQLSRTNVDGLIETSGISMPANAMILDLDFGIGVPSFDRQFGYSDRIENAHHYYTLARFKRSFRILREAAHDIEQKSRFIRRERSVATVLSRVDNLTRVLWLGHEFFTSSGENWRYPVVVLICNAMLFISLLLYSDPHMEVSLAIAISATNSIAPFLTLQSIVEKTNLFAVVLSLFQSAFTAALLSSIVISLRAKIEN